MRMKIDILSDLHLDFYFPIDNVQSEAVCSIYDPIFFQNGTRTPADVLIIAGDLGHYNSQNIQVLKILQQKYCKYIICVLGNHDYYLLNYSQEKEYKKNSFLRAKEMKELISAQENMYCLDGDVVEIEGVKFGGAMSWYNDGYLSNKLQAFTHEMINDMWKQYNNDSRYILGIKRFDELYEIEFSKIEAVYKACDVMITHINPSCEDKHITLSFKNQNSNVFFTFDGDKYLQETTARYWIYGHTHNEMEYEKFGVTCICNPFGYPAESSYGDDVWMKSIEI